MLRNWEFATHTRALMKSGPSDRVVLHAPGTTEQLQVFEVRYERIPVKPFSEPPVAGSAPQTALVPAARPPQQATLDRRAGRKARLRHPAIPETL